MLRGRGRRRRRGFGRCAVPGRTGSARTPGCRRTEAPWRPGRSRAGQPAFGGSSHAVPARNPDRKAPAGPQVRSGGTAGSRAGAPDRAGHRGRAPCGDPGAGPAEEAPLREAGALEQRHGLVVTGDRPRGPVHRSAGLLPADAGGLLCGAGGEGTPGRWAVAVCRSMAAGSSGRDQDGHGSAGARGDGGQGDAGGLRPWRRRRRRRSGAGPYRRCTRSGPCAGPCSPVPKRCRPRSPAARRRRRRRRCPPRPPGWGRARVGRGRRRCRRRRGRGRPSDDRPPSARLRRCARQGTPGHDGPTRAVSRSSSRSGCPAAAGRPAAVVPGSGISPW